MTPADRLAQLIRQEVFEQRDLPLTASDITFLAQDGAEKLLARGVRVVSPTDPPRLNEAHLAMLLDEMFTKTPPLYGSSFKERWAQIQAWAATLLPRLTAFVGPTDSDLREALEPFAKYADEMAAWEQRTGEKWGERPNVSWELPAKLFDACRRARAALQDSRPAGESEIRLGDLASVNIRNGVAFSYCPECGTEQGPVASRVSPPEGP